MTFLLLVNGALCAMQQQQQSLQEQTFHPIDAYVHNLGWSLCLEGRFNIDFPLIQQHTDYIVHGGAQHDTTLTPEQKAFFKLEHGLYTFRNNQPACVHRALQGIDMIAVAYNKEMLRKTKTQLSDPLIWENSNQSFNNCVQLAKNGYEIHRRGISCQACRELQ